MKKFLKFVGWAFGIMIVLGVIANLTGEADPPKEEPKKEVVQEKPKEEKPKEEPKVEEPDIDAEIAYTDMLAVVMTDSSLIMTDLTTLFTDASMDASLITDPQYRQDIVDVYTELEGQRAKVVAYKDVPPKLQKVHSLTIESFDLLLESRDRVLQGIDTLDPDQIYQATDLINEGSLKILEVGEELNKYIEEML